MSRHAFAIAITVAGLFVSNRVAAQTQDTPPDCRRQGFSPTSKGREQKQKEADENKKQCVVEATEASSQSEFPASAQDVALTVIDGEGRLGASFSFVDASSLWEFKVSAPFKDGPKKASPASLDGLAKGSTAEIRRSFISWSGKADFDTAERLCTALAAKKGDPDLAGNCDDVDFDDPERDAFLAATDLGHPRLIAFSGKVSRNDYRWFESSTLKDQKMTHNSWSGTLTVGAYKPRSGFWFGEAEYSSSFKEADAFDVCTPIGSTAATKCRNVALDKAPTNKKATTLRLDVRKFLSADVAIEPTFSYEAKEKVKAIQFPIYFLKAKSSVSGGIKVGWRSDTKTPTAEVFVGAALKPWGGPPGIRSSQGGEGGQGRGEGLGLEPA